MLANTVFQHQKKIGYWLLIGTVMLVIQVLLGGITRLTGSGLSITEWKPILGTLPPFSTHDWEIAFEMYKQKTAQFKFLNNDFSLADFKFIYFWEWLHRTWARALMIVFIIPFIYFSIKKWLSVKQILLLIALFSLGALQGLVGWIMVKSGLNDDAQLYVKHIELAAHFISALILIGFTFLYALHFLIPVKKYFYSSSLKKITVIIFLLLMLQLKYGAFMAGLKAAQVAATFPLINGSIIPTSLFTESIVNNKLNVQFIHRTTAYLLFLLICFFTFKVRKSSSLLMKKYTYLPLSLISIQVTLGICSLLFSIHTVRNGMGLFEWTALLHQLIAVMLFLSFVFFLFIIRNDNRA